MEEWNLKVTPPLPQQFSLPKPLMKYISEKPENPIAYFKLTNSCKFFYLKNHIIVAESVKSNHNKWEVLVYDGLMCGFEAPCINYLDELPCQVWILHRLRCYEESDLRKLIPKIYRCDAEILNLDKQKISFKEFLFISSSAKEVDFDRVRINYDDGSPVMLETILGTFKNLKSFRYVFEVNNDRIIPISSESMKNIVQLTNLENLKKFTLEEIPDIFDFENFETFFKNHKKTKFSLHFCAFPLKNKNKMDAFLDYLIQTTDDVKFWIYYPGVDNEKRRILHEKLYDQLSNLKMEEWNLQITPPMPQQFPLPKPLMKYISEKPENPIAYIKLTNSCKFFYLKNHIIVASFVDSHDSHWEVLVYDAPWSGFEAPMIDGEDLDELPCQVWILHRLRCYEESDIRNFIPKIYRCDAEILELDEQRISFKEFLFISSSAKEVDFKRVRISYDDGSPVMLETILGTLKNLTSFRYEFEVYGDIIIPFSSESMKNIVQLTNVTNLNKFTLEEIPEIFDFENFETFYKNHKKTKFSLNFRDVSEANKIKMDAFMDYLIQITDGVNFWIDFPGINYIKRNILHKKFNVK